MYNKSEIEAKALELYPDTEFVQYTNWILRAAFIKGCQYAATPSAVSREDAEKWARERYPEQAEDANWLEAGQYEAAYFAAMKMYDHLASLSPAQPGFSEQQVREAIELRSEYDTDNWGVFAGFKYTSDEIISLLNKHP